MRVEPATSEFSPIGSFGATDCDELPRRAVWPAIANGLRRRCPNCGQGRLLRGYLKVTPRCDECDENLSHQRADDAPPYLTIVVVGHIIVPLILFVETRWPLSTVAHLSIWLPLTLILSLLLLPVMKGAVVGLQWALRMHGFDGRGGEPGGPEYILEPEAAVSVDSIRHDTRPHP